MDSDLQTLEKLFEQRYNEMQCAIKAKDVTSVQVYISALASIDLLLLKHREKERKKTSEFQRPGQF